MEGATLESGCVKGTPFVCGRCNVRVWVCESHNTEMWVRERHVVGVWVCCLGEDTLSERVPKIQFLCKVCERRNVGI